MFKFLTGSYRALEKECIDDILRLKRANPLAPVLILSPSGHMLTRLQDFLSRRLRSLLNIQTVGFYALADRLLATDESATKDRLISEPALFSEVIRDLLEGTSDVEFVSRKYFSPPGKTLPKGLPGALAETLRDMRDSGARVVDSLRAALEGHLGESAPEAAPTLELYARTYEVLQKHGLRTNADQLRRAAARVASDPFIASQAAIYIYGIYDLTGVQLDFVSAFRAHASAKLFFVYEPQAAYTYAERLLNDAALVGGAAERQTLNTPARTPAIEVWNCSGAYDEVWLAAKKILAWTEEGVAYSDIAVVARSLAPYITAVRDVFQAHGIPYTSAQEEPVGAYPLVKWIRQLFSLDAQDYPESILFDILGSPYCRLDAADSMGANPVPIYKRVARQAGITSGWASWQSRLTHWAAGKAPSEDPHAREAAGSLQRLLAALHNDLSKDATRLFSWNEHAARAKKSLGRWMKMPLDASSEELQLWEAVADTLESLATLDSLGKPVPRAHFLEVWNEKLDALSVPLSPQNNQGVQVIDVMSARGLSFRTVALMGLNEKSFPRLIREDPFLSDAARSALSGALGCRLSRKLDGYQEERLLFNVAKEMAEDRLLLSYQRSDEEGKALVPSLYLHELPETGVSRHHLARTPAEKWAQIGPDHLTPKELSIWLNREGENSEALCDAAGFDGTLYRTLIQSQLELDSFRQPLGARDGMVGPQTLLSDIASRGFSPDSLKDLAECPFRYFAGKVLGLNVLDEWAPSGELAADASGKLIHKILESFFRQLRDLGGRPLEQRAMHALLDSVCERTFKNFKETSVDLYPVAWKATQSVIRRRLHLFLEADLAELSASGFKPAFLEEEIEGELPQGGELLKGARFHGRVDRIDVREKAGATEYRVVDYKTGRATKAGTRTETAILRGQYLQLPVYLGVTEKWLSEKLGTPARPFAASFYNLADWEKGEESPSMGPEFWERHGRLFGENLAGLLSLVREGIFYVRPSQDMEYCSWCEYSQICRKDHKPTAARSEQHATRLANDERLSRKAERD